MSAFRSTVLPLLITALLAGASGCDPYYDYCEARMSCLNGNETDIEACTIELEAEEDKADLWGCLDRWEDYQACREEFSTCDPNNYEYTHHDRCNPERDRYTDCIH